MQISCDNSIQFVTDIIQTTGLFSKLIQYTMLILSTIPSCTMPPCVWATVLLTVYLLRFRVDGLKFSIHIGCTRKLLDPHFHEMMWPISVHPCWYTIACLPNCSHANELQTTTWCLQFCFVLFCFVLFWERMCVVGACACWMAFYNGFLTEELVELFRIFFLSYHQSLPLPGVYFYVRYTGPSP